jgi:hypothetical protein
MMSVEKNESIYGLSGASIASDRESVIVLRERVRELNYNIYILLVATATILADPDGICSNILPM